MTAAAPVTTRTTCRTCGSGDLALVVDLGPMPLAGGFVPPDDPRADERYPLRVARCGDCTLMQVLDTVAPERIFTTYSYASSTNRMLVAHFEAVARDLVAAADARGRLVVEFGCNDGVLLRPLRALGAEAVGVDPSDVARRASEEGGWPLYPAYFDAEVAARIREERGPARVVVGNNVCAHVDDLHALIAGVTTLLADDGLFALEVHYQGDLLEQVQFDTIYHEHICYHSLGSIARLLEQHGLEVTAARRIPVHSGSIHVEAARRGARAPAPEVARLLAAERGWDAGRFAERVEVRRATLCTLVGDLVAAGRRVAAYGASGRATVLLNACGLGPELIENVSDLSPLRTGRVVPGVRVPVVPRAAFHADPPDYALLTAWNYADEVVADEQRFLRAGGRLIVPLPEVRLVGAA